MRSVTEGAAPGTVPHTRIESSHAPLFVAKLVRLGVFRDTRPAQQRRTGLSVEGPLPPEP